MTLIVKSERRTVFVISCNIQDIICMRAHHLSGPLFLGHAVCNVTDCIFFIIVSWAMVFILLRYVLYQLPPHNYPTSFLVGRTLFVCLFACLSCLCQIILYKIWTRSFTQKAVVTKIWTYKIRKMASLFSYSKGRYDNRIPKHGSKKKILNHITS